MKSQRNANEKNNAYKLPMFYGFDWTLVFVVFVILVFGLVMLYSASSYSAQSEGSASYAYVLKQLFPIGLGIVFMFIITFIPHSFWKKISVFVYIIGLIAVLLVKTPLGVSLNGASRWLRIGPLSVQPAEILKIGVILIMAYLICKWMKKINNIKYVILVAAFDFIAAGAIVLITDDLGTAIIVFAMGLIMLIASNVKARYILLLVGIVVAAAVIFMVSEPYRMDRVNAWLNIEAYADSDGFQVLQGLYAIGSGGLFGKGLGKSTQKLGYVPESQSDMIFTIICEELGIIGGIVLIILIVLLIWRMKKIYDESRNLYSKVVVAGVAGHIAVQTIINLCVVTNLIPNTGVPLPFISYGGTAVMLQLVEIGLVLSVARQNELEELENLQFVRKPEYGYRRGNY